MSSCLNSMKIMSRILPFVCSPLIILAPKVHIAFALANISNCRQTIYRVATQHIDLVVTFTLQRLSFKIIPKVSSFGVTVYLSFNLYAHSPWGVTFAQSSAKVTKNALLSQRSERSHNHRQSFALSFTNYCFCSPLRWIQVLPYRWLFHFYSLLQGNSFPHSSI